MSRLDQPPQATQKRPGLPVVASRAAPGPVDLDGLEALLEQASYLADGRRIEATRPTAVVPPRSRGL